MEHSTSHDSIAAMRGAVVAVIFLAGIATGMLSAQGVGGRRGGNQ